MKQQILSITATVFLICLVSSAYAVTIDGKNWRQLTETINVSWAELDQIYDTNTGKLDTTISTIGSIDFNGWIWATEAEIAEMMSVVTGLTVTVDYTNFELSSSWAPSFLSTFDPTLSSTSSRQVSGWSRDLTASLNRVQSQYVRDYSPGSTVRDTIELAGSWGSNTVKNDHNGVWLYEGDSFAVASVPEPATMVLFSIGLLGLAGISRKKAAISN